MEKYKNYFSLSLKALSLGGATIVGATLTVTVQKATLTASSVVLEGTLENLYDWDYDGDFPEIDRHGARVQAGYNTHGIAGNIYRIQIDLDTPTPHSGYDFN